MITIPTTIIAKITTITDIELKKSRLRNTIWILGPTKVGLRSKNRRKWYTKNMSLRRITIMANQSKSRRKMP